MLLQPTTTKKKICVAHRKKLSNFLLATLGFAGDTCEVVLEQCDTNPCRNDALCYVVDDEYRCYCVPDFHGKRCEYKYNDCFLPPLPKCFNGGQCIDAVDDYKCSCENGFFGDNCECPAEAVDDPSLCINVNESVSWDLPSPDILALWTTTYSPEEETTTVLPDDRLDDKGPYGLEVDPPSLDGSIDPSNVIMAPTSTIVYNFSEPVTSLYIYEISSSDLITRSFLAGDDYIIRTSPTLPSEEMGNFLYHMVYHVTRVSVVTISFCRIDRV